MPKFDDLIYNELTTNPIITATLDVVKIGNIDTPAVFNGRVPEKYSEADPACNFYRLTPINTQALIGQVTYSLITSSKSKSSMDNLSEALTQVFKENTISFGGKDYYFHVELQVPTIPDGDDGYWNTPVLVNIYYK